MNSIEIWNDLGNLYFKGNAIDEAINVYNKAIDLGYESPEIYKNLAIAHAGSGNFPEAISLYKKCVELAADNNEKALVLTSLGDCYRQVGDLDSAIGAFKAAIEIEPGNPELCIGLGAVQRDLERLYGFEQSEDKSTGDVVAPEENREEQTELMVSDEPEMTTSLESEPNPVVDLAANAVEVEELHVLEPALEEIQVSCTPPFLINDVVAADLESLNNAGDVEEKQPRCAEQNQINELDIQKEESVRLTLLLTLGVMHWRNGNLEEAEEILQSAITTAAKLKHTWFEALCWHALALVKTSLGDLKASIQAYLRAVELAPEQIFPWNNLGTLYNNMGANDEAMASFHKAIRQNPEDPASWDGLGDIYTKLGRLDDAIAAYQLGNVFVERAQGQDAITAYEKAFAFYKFTLASLENGVSESQADVETMDEPQDQAVTFTEPEMLAIANPEILESLVPGDETPGDNLVEDLANTGSEVQAQSLMAVGADQIEEILQPVGEGQNQETNSVEEIFADLVSHIADNEEADMSAEPALKPDFDKTQPLLLDPRPTENILVTKTMSQLAPDEKNLEQDENLPNLQYPLVMPSVIMLDTPEDEENWEYDQVMAGLGELKEGATPPDEDMLGAPGVKDESSEIGEPDLAQSQAVGTEESEAPQAAPKSVVDEIVPAQDQSAQQLHEPEPEPIQDAVADSPNKTESERIAGTIASYEAVVKQNPKNDRAWDSLGNLYRITQRNAEAILAFEQAVILQPDKYVYHYQLGCLYAAEGNYTEAIREIQKVIELNSNFIFAHCALASYLRKIGQNEEAELHIAIALPHMENEKEYDRACFESIRGNNDLALELLTTALEKKQTTIEWIRRDLDLDFIRQDARYEQLEAKFAHSTIRY